MYLLRLVLQPFKHVPLNSQHSPTIYQHVETHCCKFTRNRFLYVMYQMPIHSEHHLDKLPRLCPELWNCTTSRTATNATCPCFLSHSCLHAAHLNEEIKTRTHADQTYINSDLHLSKVPHSNKNTKEKKEKKGKISSSSPVTPTKLAGGRILHALTVTRITTPPCCPACLWCPAHNAERLV